MDEKIDSMMEAPHYSWRDILQTVLEGMDAWNVDIVELASRYGRKVDEMMDLNFRLPANVVLVSSVLLRMKADLLSPDEKRDPYDLRDHMLFVFDSNYPIDAILASGMEEDPYGIQAKPVRSLKRRVTADELIDALQSVLKENERKAERKYEALEVDVAEKEEDVLLKDEVSIVKLIEETYKSVLERLSGREEVVLSEFARTTEELITTFISLLHLVNDRKVALRQENLYGEVYINKI